MYHQRPVLPMIQPVSSNSQFPGGTLSSDAPLRHSSASLIVHSRRYSHPKPVHTFPENSQSSCERTDKVTLPSFRETFPDHVGPHLLQPGIWEGRNFQLRRGSPCPSSVHDGESHGSQHSSPYAPSRSITPDTIYVYPPQPRSRSPPPPPLQNMASLRLSANSCPSPMSSFEPSPFTTPSEPPPLTNPQRGLKLSIPSPFAPHPHTMPTLNEHSIGSPGIMDDVQMLPEDHYQENRRPVLRPVQQRLPAGLLSDWEQFVREIRDENGDYYLQCIWDIDTGHACMYQAEKQAMKRHVEVTHMRIKPHKCPYCDKRFGQKTAMKVHRATHTGETPLECGFKCGRYFSDPARRHRHYTHDHNYTPRKRHNTNRNRARQAKEARAAAAVRAARSPSYSD